MNVVAPIHVNFKENGGTHKDQEDDASPFRTSTEISVLNVAIPVQDILLTICVPVCI